MSNYCQTSNLKKKYVDNTINAKSIVIQCLNAFKKLDESKYIKEPKCIVNYDDKDNKNDGKNTEFYKKWKNRHLSEEEILAKEQQNYENKYKELNNIGVRVLLYYATPENRIATANYYKNYLIIDDLPKIYKNFIKKDKMFEPLRNATHYRFLSINGDVNSSCLALIKARIYFDIENTNRSYDESEMKKVSIDYKFVLQRIYMPERHLNYDWRVASITIA